MALARVPSGPFLAATFLAAEPSADLAASLSPFLPVAGFSAAASAFFAADFLLAFPSPPPPPPPPPFVPTLHAATRSPP